MQSDSLWCIYLCLGLMLFSDFKYDKRFIPLFILWSYFSLSRSLSFSLFRRDSSEKLISLLLFTRDSICTIVRERPGHDFKNRVQSQLIMELLIFRVSLKKSEEINGRLKNRKWYRKNFKLSFLSVYSFLSTIFTRKK